MNAAIITRRGSGGSGFGGLQLISSTFILGNSDGQINIPDNGHFYIFGNIYEDSGLQFIEIKNYAILSAVRYFEGSINSTDISENFSMSGAVLTDAYRSSSFRYDRLFRALSVKSLPTLQNPATNAEIKSGYQAIDQEGNVIKGTLTVPTTECFVTSWSNSSSLKTPFTKATGTLKAYGGLWFNSSYTYIATGLNATQAEYIKADGGDVAGYYGKQTGFSLTQRTDGVYVNIPDQWTYGNCVCFVREDS